MESPQKIVFAPPGRPEPAAAVSPVPPEALLDLLTRNLGAAVTVIGPDLRFIYTNDVFAKWFGLRAEALVGVSIHDVYGAHNRASYERCIERALAGETLHYQREVRSPGGREEWHTICLTPCRNARGEVVGVTSAALDVRSLRATTEALRTADQRLSFHIENSPLAVIEVDSELVLTHCSRRATELFGWAHGEARGRPLLSLLAATGDADDHHAPLQAALARLRGGIETSNRSETAHTGADGAPLHCAWFNSALTDAQGQVVSIMALVEDVSAQVRSETQWREMAERDPLTGLFNRSVFEVRLDASLAKARRSGGEVALLFIDLDGFKRVNDTLGHRAGDGVLRDVAQRLLGVVRESDTLARLGGDEFVVILDADVHTTVVDSLSERIVAALAAPFIVAGAMVSIGASIGVAMQPAHGGHADRLISRADEAMYEAKRAGKGCVRHAVRDRAS